MRVQFLKIHREDPCPRRRLRNRRPEDGRIGEKGIYMVCARVHAQIVRGDLPRALIRAIDFASIKRPNECAARAPTIRRHFLDPCLCRL